MIKNKKKWVALSWLMAVMMISDPFAILAESNAVLPQITAEVQENSLIGSDQAGYGASPDNSAENGAIENGSAEGGPAGNGPTENGSAESGSAANGSTENDPPTNDQPGDDPAAGGDAEGDLDQPQQGSEGDANGETGSGPEDVLQGGQDDSLEDQENIESIEITEFETCETIVIVPGTLQEELMLPDYILATDSLGQNVEVPVTWECENYLPEEKGCYDFQAVFPEEQYVISCEIPTIMVIVAVTCTCRDESGELVGVHDPENQACVLYGEEAVILTMPDGTVLITSASDAEIYMAAGAVLVSKVMSARATEGENSLLMMNYMQAEIDEISAKADTEIYNTGIITGQEASDIGLSYAWWKYVNRIWKYKALDKFSWTVDPKDSLGNVLKKWGGTASFMPASAEHLPENEPDVIPTSSISGKTITYTVYYGEQLRYALEHEAVNKIKTYTQIVINLQNDINLDGATQNWTTVSLYQAGYPRLQINGNNHTIYNFGKFHQKNESGVIGTTPENNQYHGAGMVIATGGMEVSDIKFESAMIVASKDSKAPSVGILGKTEAAIGNWAIRKPSTISNVTIDHSLFYSGMQESNVSPMGVFNLNTNNMGGKPAIRGATVTQCSLEGNYIYGGNHAAGLTVGNYMGTTSNTYVIDTLIATYGGHSGGFMSCNVGSVDSFHHTLAEGESGIATITNCFAEVDMYAAVDSGGFVGLFSGDITNCFSTGKLEGFCRCGGFSSATSNSGVYGNANITRCYSTTLVGLREESQYMGGFHSTATMGQYPRLTNYKFTDCYAAGEVGDINVSASDSATAQEVRHDGGFFSSVESGRGTNDVTAGNCYYDKQTTAMREKMVAEYQYGNTVPSQVGNVSGVLTSQYQKKDGTVVYGLASGTYDAGATEGFRGFSDNSHWSYQSGYYPQLNVFANASVGNGWNAKQCQTAASYSKASASTAALNNWAEGYTWSSLGVRSSDDTIMDHTSGNHKLGKESYDTVRSMTTDARLTASSAFTSRFGDTKTVDMTDKRTGTTEKVSSFTYENASHHLAMITNPGMDWADVKDSSGSGKRVMRLISVMAVGAGSDQYVYAGTKYDHRADVSLTGSISVVPNLVVGLDNDKIWSKTEIGGYATEKESSKEGEFTDAFYAATTYNMNRKDESGNEVAYYDGWLYTEIWKVKQSFDKDTRTEPNNLIWAANANGDAYTDHSRQPEYYWRTETDSDGNLGTFLRKCVTPGTADEGMDSYVEDISVKVTGAGTDTGTTIDEQKWNGEIPLYPDTATMKKYILSYYWVMKDGRYRTDNKVATISPGLYNMYMNVYNSAPGETDEYPVTSKNPYALMLEPVKDDYTPDPADPFVPGTYTPNYDLTGDATVDSAVYGPAGTGLPGSDTYVTSKDASIGYTNDSAAVWKKLNPDINIQKMKVTMTARNGDIMGTGELVKKTAEGIAAGDEIAVTTQYYTVINQDYGAEGIREVTETQRVKLIYKVQEDSDGNLYLAFEKLANLPDAYDMAEGAGTETTEGMVTVDADGNETAEEVTAYINDTMYNIQVDFWVESYDLTLEKLITGSYANSSDVFNFSVALETHRGKDVSIPYDKGTDADAGTLEYDASTGGVKSSTITLGQKEKITIKGIPKGVKYTIAELRGKGAQANPDFDKYVTSVEVNGNVVGATASAKLPVSFVQNQDRSERTTQGVLDETTNKVSYRNHWEMVTPTGEKPFSIWPYLLAVMAVLLTTGTGFGICIGKKRKKAAVNSRGGSPGNGL